jgi:hypothetical protein
MTSFGSFLVSVSILKMEFGDLGLQAGGLTNRDELIGCVCKFTKSREVSCLVFHRGCVVHMTFTLCLVLCNVTRGTASKSSYLTYRS